MSGRQPLATDNKIYIYISGHKSAIETDIGDC